MQSAIGGFLKVIQKAALPFTPLLNANTPTMSAFSLAEDDIPQFQQPQQHSADSVLVLGSMDRMAEYQHLLQLLRSRDPQAQVQGEMVDRVLQNGEFDLRGEMW